MRTRRGVSTTAVIAVVIVVVVIGIAAVALLPSTKSSSTTSSTSTTSTTSTNRDAAVYQAALTDGSVVVYGSPNAAQFANITAAFNAVYPGITVHYTSLQPPQAVPQVESEESAQGHSADILLQAATTVYTLEPAGSACSCVKPYVSSYASDFPKAVLDPLNQSTPIIELAFGWAYNTNMISAANVPTTMAQVANAQFKGEIVMNDPTTGTAFTQYWASLEGVLGNSTVTTFLHDLKNATSPTIVPTTTSCMNDVASGAYAICLGGYMQDAAPDIQAGAPMKFLNITGLPLMLTPSNAAILKNAVHPNAAQLLIDFMASPAGQTAWGNINVRTPVSLTVTAKWSLTSEIAAFYPGAGTQIYFPTPQVATSASAWAATFAFLKA
ncbi:MAG TPA: extracellular solute-binding protein [Nitrososphaerales archaeon]|nr:extracellular solute-binding protein [Nitrososphaerales archaeon]